MTRSIGRLCLLVVVGLVVGQPLFFSQDPMHPTVERSLEAPGFEHLLGTDEIGRDVLARVATGGRYSLVIAFLAVVLSSAIGLVLGLVAGIMTGTIDRTIGAIVDVLLAFPRFVLLLNIAALISFRSIFVVGVVIGLTSWMRTTRLVKNEVLSIRERKFVEASRATGATTTTVILWHVLPHVLGLVLETARLRVASVVLVAASLDFLGVGLPLDSPTWGGVIRGGQNHLVDAPWVAGAAIAALCLTAVGLVLAGEKPAAGQRTAVSL